MWMYSICGSTALGTHKAGHRGIVTMECSCACLFMKGQKEGHTCTVARLLGKAAIESLNGWGWVLWVGVRDARPRAPQSRVATTQPASCHRKQLTKSQEKAGRKFKSISQHAASEDKSYASTACKFKQWRNRWYQIQVHAVGPAMCTADRVGAPGRPASTMKDGMSGDDTTAWRMQKPQHLDKV